MSTRSPPLQATEAGYARKVADFLEADGDLATLARHQYGLNIEKPSVPPASIKPGFAPAP
ncbi:hypothetical protein H6F76_04515 [Leptolyngbya sp. FACHB-321]|uniref:hypothetical protein n=1 Tax=Leptolyngbya sp. FACHB-321 TaxID=2692807 RepID=UPI0016878902|nr:hypothetical protein [Leptolyngbya sp. FACHB-321]MBD2034302.1 hypothetical protein [Leptolyngbya sp. FACHB-321]